jgi:hypothetical protein
MKDTCEAQAVDKNGKKLAAVGALLVDERAAGRDRACFVEHHDQRQAELLPVSMGHRERCFMEPQVGDGGRRFTREFKLAR